MNSELDALVGASLETRATRQLGELEMAWRGPRATTSAKLEKDATAWLLRTDHIVVGTKMDSREGLGLVSLLTSA